MDSPRSNREGVLVGSLTLSRVTIPLSDGQSSPLEQKGTWFVTDLQLDPAGTLERCVLKEIRVKSFIMISVSTIRSERETSSPTCRIVEGIPVAYLEIT